MDALQHFFFLISLGIVGISVAPIPASAYAARCGTDASHGITVMPQLSLVLIVPHHKG